MTLADSVLIALIGVAAALLGAAVGGIFAYRGAIGAAEMTLQHEAALAREAAELERAGRREALAQQAAIQLLETLALFNRSIDAFGRAYGRGAMPVDADISGASVTVDAVMAQLSSGTTPYAHLAGPEIVTEWVQLIRALHEFMHPTRHLTANEHNSYLDEAVQHAHLLHDRLLALLTPTGPGHDAAPPT